MRRAKGEGTIQYIESKQIWAWYGYYIDIQGLKKRKALYAKSKKEVADKAAKWRRSVSNGQLLDTKHISVRDWGERWLALVAKKINQKLIINTKII